MLALFGNRAQSRSIPKPGEAVVLVRNLACVERLNQNGAGWVLCCPLQKQDSAVKTMVCAAEESTELVNSTNSDVYCRCSDCVTLLPHVGHFAD